MSKYIHEPAPNQKAKQFIEWCSVNIEVWDERYVSVARFVGSKSDYWKKSFQWRDHHKGLSHCWAVCTKTQWEEAISKKAQA